jgi:hypothetical protein
LLARAFGRSALPEWLKGRGVDGTIDVADAAIADLHLTNVRGRLLWDAARVEIDGVQADIDGASLTGRLAVSLHGSRPAYQWAGRIKGFAWQGGTLDAAGTAETSGAGLQLLRNMKAEGTFSGAGLDLGTAGPWRIDSGEYAVSAMSAGPRVRFTSLSARSGDDAYTGQGGTQDSGRIAVTLTNGAKDVRVSGTLNKLKVEE